MWAAGRVVGLDNQPYQPGKTNAWQGWRTGDEADMQVCGVAAPRPWPLCTPTPSLHRSIAPSFPAWQKAAAHLPTSVSSASMPRMQRVSGCSLCGERVGPPQKEACFYRGNGRIPFPSKANPGAVHARWSAALAAAKLAPRLAASPFVPLVPTLVPCTLLHRLSQQPRCHARSQPCPVGALSP